MTVEAPLSQVTGVLDQERRWMPDWYSWLERLVVTTNTDLKGKVGVGDEIEGTPTNDSAPPGYVGEILSSNILAGSAVTLVNAISKNITSVALTGGDWDVWGQVVFVPVTNPVTTLIAGLSETTNTLPAFSDNARTQSIASFAVGTQSAQVGAKRFNVAPAGQVVYLVINCTFAGTCTAYGYLGARRRR